MRTLLLLTLSLISGHLLAQGTSDSLLRQTDVSRSVVSQTDSLNLRIQQAQSRLDSLLRLPHYQVDSSRVGRYVQRQRDSLLSPLDTLQQKVDATKQRARALQDTLYQRVPIQQAAESLQSVTSQSLPESIRDQLSTDQIKEMLPVSLRKIAPQLPSLPPPVHAIQEHAAAWQEKLGTYTSKISAYKGTSSPYTTSLKAGSKAVEQQALQQLPEGEVLQQNHQALRDWRGQQHFDQKQQRAQLQQRLLASAQDHFANHSKSLQKAQQKLVNLKRKYTLIQGSQKQKRNSLQGKPLGERLFYGGTIQIQKGPPLALDLSPQLGYRFNKRITSGVGITYRLSLSGDSWAELRRSIATTDAVYGGRAYVEYEVVKSFFVHGEYERLSQAVPVNNQDLTARSWQVSALAGIGKTYRIAGRLQGSVLLLYNFRHQQQSVHSSPWIFRFGFQRAGAQ